MPEDSLRCQLPRFGWDRFSHWPGNLTRLARKTWTSASSSLEPELPANTSMPRSFTWILKFKHRSSCLDSKHFTDWVISLVHAQAPSRVVISVCVRGSGRTPTPCAIRGQQPTYQLISGGPLGRRSASLLEALWLSCYEFHKKTGLRKLQILNLSFCLSTSFKRGT